MRVCRQDVRSLLVAAVMVLAKRGSSAVLKDYLPVTAHLVTVLGKGNYRVAPPKDEMLCDSTNHANHVGISCKSVGLASAV